MGKWPIWKWTGIVGGLCITASFVAAPRYNENPSRWISPTSVPALISYAGMLLILFAVALAWSTARKEEREAPAENEPDKEQLNKETTTIEKRKLCCTYFVACFIAPVFVKSILDFININFGTQFTSNNFTILWLESIFAGGWAVAIYLKIRKREIPSDLVYGYVVTFTPMVSITVFNALLKWELK